MGRFDKNFEISMNGFTGMGRPSTADTGTEPNPENFYKASAVLAHYKGLLNEKLKAKNPEAYKKYFEDLVQLRRAGKTQDAMKYVQEAEFNDYLTPKEVKETLGDTGYKKYLDSLKQVNDFNVAQGNQPLYGEIEGENDISNLNYGRRFASLQLTPSLSVFSNTSGKRYSRAYKYNPEADQIDYTEEGDLNLKPSYITN